MKKVHWTHFISVTIFFTFWHLDITWCAIIGAIDLTTRNAYTWSSVVGGALTGDHVIDQGLNSESLSPAVVQDLRHIETGLICEQCLSLPSSLYVSHCHEVGDVVANEDSKPSRQSW